MPKTRSLTELRKEIANERKIPEENIIITDKSTGIALGGENIKESIEYQLTWAEADFKESTIETANHIRRKISEKYNISTDRIKVTHNKTGDSTVFHLAH